MYSITSSYIPFAKEYTIRVDKQSNRESRIKDELPTNNQTFLKSQHLGRHIKSNVQNFHPVKSLIEQEQDFRIIITFLDAKGYHIHIFKKQLKNWTWLWNNKNHLRRTIGMSTAKGYVRDPEELTNMFFYHTVQDKIWKAFIERKR